MVKIEIKIQGVVRDNIVCKWVTKEQLAFLRTLEDDNWALKYKYCALFPIDFEELTKFVLKKRPTLKGKDFRIAF